MARWSMPEHRLVVSVLCGVIYLTVVGSAFGDEKAFDGVYVGKRVLIKGPAQLCIAEEEVSVTIQGDVLLFTNSRLQKFPLSFNPGPDGSFGEFYVGDAGMTAAIKGRIAGDIIEADVDNKPCIHHWHLKREHRSQ